MTEVREIIHRLRMGQSQRHIQKDLGVHRSIIRKIHRLTISQEWLSQELPMPSDAEITRFWKPKASNQPHPLDIYKEQLAQWDEQSLSSVVIQQLLKDQCPCDVQVIRRYRQKHFTKRPEPIMTRETVPGKDLDVDFGELGYFLDDSGIRRKVWLLSLRLRHSRKAYREIVLDQSQRTFLMGHIHAFEYFGGVPKYCIPDNTKAAVTKSTVDNDLISRPYQELAEHYRFIIHPCLPRTPEHKGGVEGDVKYVKRNFVVYFLTQQKELKIITPKICDLREALEKWEREVADIRIVHGVGRSPLELFNSEEAKMLQPLPKSRWEPTSWYRCHVRREWKIMIDSAYYSVPHQLIGETVDVCVTHSLVRIFHKQNEVAAHARATKKWEYQRKGEHAPPFHEAVLQCNREGLLNLAENIGQNTFNLVEAILAHPSVEKLKPVRHLLNLSKKYSCERLEKACARALHFKMHSYISVKNILENNLDPLPFEGHITNKVISLPCPRFARDPTDYKSLSKKESFEEKLERVHPVSKHGNAMMPISQMVLADQIMDEYLEEEKRKNNFIELAEQ